MKHFPEICKINFWIPFIFVIFLGRLAFGDVTEKPQGKKIEIYIDGKRYDSLKSYRDDVKTNKARQNASAGQLPETPQKQEESPKGAAESPSDASTDRSLSAEAQGVPAAVSAPNESFPADLLKGLPPQAYEQVLRGLLNDQVNKESTAFSGNQQESQGNLIANKQEAQPDEQENPHYRKSMRDLRSILEFKSR